MVAVNVALLTHDPSLAVRRLRSGGLVALPTETVYGLGAVATDPVAVRRVFQAKGRPVEHPLIVHLADGSVLGHWAADVPAAAARLAEACWPGPLTLVLRRSASVLDVVTGGLGTVAVRVPDHPLTAVVLGELGTGVVAPSANRFGRVSPTTAQHVLDELADVLVPGRDLVLDGGPARVGVESTIVDCTGEQPVLLRPGAIGAAEVVRIAGAGLGVASPDGPVRAPGMLAAHYAPAATVRVLVGADDLADLVPDASMGVLAMEEVPTPSGMVRLAAPADVPGYAKVLYRALRDADALGLGGVLAIPPDGPGLAAAVRDRLNRAAAGR